MEKDTELICKLVNDPFTGSISDAHAERCAIICLEYLAANQLQQELKEKEIEGMRSSNEALNKLVAYYEESDNLFHTKSVKLEVEVFNLEAEIERLKEVIVNLNDQINNNID